MIAVVTGMIGSYPLGGVLWDYGQYLLGLERMGFLVYYLEDTGWWTFNPLNPDNQDDCSYGVDFLASALPLLSPTLGKNWHFRNMDGRTFGIAPEQLKEVIKNADLFLNISGGTLLRDEYMICKNKILIDTDPGWNHFRNFPRWDADPVWRHLSHGYRAHDHFFTYAERLGKSDCPLPAMGLPWQITRPPVLTDLWRSEPPGQTWTSVMSWKSYNEKCSYNGVTYGNKEMEFPHIENLPKRSPGKFEVAVLGPDAPMARWRELGWSAVDAFTVSKTPEIYRRYIQSSRGELAISKNVYVGTRSGWFSCRSVCYLAAGLPVIVQDTGFSEHIPTGEGLFAFSDQAQAAEAIAAVERDYARHQGAARELAHDHFDATKVLGQLLERIGLN